MSDAPRTAALIGAANGPDHSVLTRDHIKFNQPVHRCLSHLEQHTMRTARSERLARLGCVRDHI